MKTFKCGKHYSDRAHFIPLLFLMLTYIIK